MDVTDTQRTEMVCGRTITQNPPYANTAEYRGNKIVFCTRYCLEAFEADPDRFYVAHCITKEPLGNSVEPSRIGEIHERTYRSCQPLG